MRASAFEWRACRERQEHHTQIRKPVRRFVQRQNPVAPPQGCASQDARARQSRAYPKPKLAVRLHTRYCQGPQARELLRLLPVGVGSPPRWILVPTCVAAESERLDASSWREQKRERSPARRPRFRVLRVRWSALRCSGSARKTSIDLRQPRESESSEGR